jgi:hypothetical protein
MRPVNALDKISVSMYHLPRMMVSMRYRHVVLPLVLGYFLWSALAISIVTQHSIEHDKHTRHAAKHASVACQLLCSAAVFFTSVDVPPSSSPVQSSEPLTILHETHLPNLHVFALLIRPPPALLA